MPAGQELINTGAVEILHSALRVEGFGYGSPLNITRMVLHIPISLLWWSLGEFGKGKGNGQGINTTT